VRLRNGEAPDADGGDAAPRAEPDGHPSREPGLRHLCGTRPLRATKVSASQQVVIEDARIYGFGDTIGYGGHTALALAGDVPYPLWIDTRDLGGRPPFA
jgi:hypothetical protein